MDGLQKFLDRYKHLIPPEGSKKKVFIETIRTECGILLEDNDVVLRGNGVQLHCHPTIRGEIRLHAPKILSILHQKHNVRISFIR